jgi:hypothetical protein
MYVIFLLKISCVSKQVPTQEPKNLAAANWTTTSTIPVSWLPIPPEYTLGQLESYKLTYQRIMVGEEKVEDGPLHEIAVPPEQSKYLLSGLDSYTLYEITVSGVTSAGKGPKARVVTGKLITNESVIYAKKKICWRA